MMSADGQLRLSREGDDQDQALVTGLVAVRIDMAAARLIPLPGHLVPVRQLLVRRSRRRGEYEGTERLNGRRRLVEQHLCEPAVLGDGTDFGGHPAPGQRLGLCERGALTRVEATRQPDPAACHELLKPMRFHSEMKTLARTVMQPAQ